MTPSSSTSTKAVLGTDGVKLQWVLVWFGIGMNVLHTLDLVHMYGIGIVVLYVLGATLLILSCLGASPLGSGKVKLLALRLYWRDFFCSKSSSVAEHFVFVIFPLHAFWAGHVQMRVYLILMLAYAGVNDQSVSGPPSFWLSPLVIRSRHGHQPVLG
ncbi:hypothetical protein BC829DRAFT_81516 [Chytridium lagenaria]|nr:hypothetical protein BC829DRAFT_81516 [Chytridium lagenaria]